MNDLYLASGNQYEHICNTCGNTSTHDFISKELYCLECESIMVYNEEDQIAIQTYIQELKAM